MAKATLVNLCRKHFCSVLLLKQLCDENLTKIQRCLNKNRAAQQEVAWADNEVEILTGSHTGVNKTPCQRLSDTSVKASNYNCFVVTKQLQQDS